MDRGRQIGIQRPGHKTLPRQRSDEIDEERSARAILGGAFFEDRPKEAALARPPEIGTRGRRIHWRHGGDRRMWTAWLLLTLNGLFFTLRLAGATGSFPRALKREEEQELLQRMAQGDMDARDQLIEHNLRLVAHIIKNG